ncbi:hypothetical protein [Methylobacterium marchantiae]|uniref:Uncharacterized protein n=1 Tax=Methylobacterium marchantiae TaxID=600331 RepID=A0ABW3WV62_9HYPH|nr:hypothetical protein AIGOOFII_0771 [Methylobacterium marchantiae]
MVKRLEWATGSVLRRGAGEDSLYICPPSLHPAAFRIALTTPLCATLLVLSAMVLFS